MQTKREAYRYPECGHAAMTRKGKIIRLNADGELTVAVPAKCRTCRRIANEAAEIKARVARKSREQADREARGAKLARVSYGCYCACDKREVPADGPDEIREPLCPACRRYAELEAWRTKVRPQIQAALRSMGYRCERRARKSSGSSYYHKALGNGRTRRVRLSDHELPQTPEREHYHGLGMRSYDHEIVLDRVWSEDEIRGEMAFLAEWDAE